MFTMERGGVPVIAVPRDPRAVAKEFLDNAVRMSPRAHPEVRPFVLMHVARNYDVFSPREAQLLFRQAFQSARDLANRDDMEIRTIVQAEIVKSFAELDLDEAAKLLKQINCEQHSDALEAAYERVLVLMLQKARLDDAVELLASVPPRTPYPYAAAGMVFERLPLADFRRYSIFGNAIAAFRQVPRGAFPLMVARIWQQTPRPMVMEALQVISEGIDRRTDLGPPVIAGSTWVSAKAAELLPVIGVMQEVDGMRATSLIGRYPELKSVKALSPIRREPPQANSDIYDEDVESGTRDTVNWSASEERAAQVVELAATDPLRALSRVPEIPLPVHQADALGAIARAPGSGAPETINAILSRCETLVNEIKRPAERVQVWMSLAEAAQRQRDDARMWRALTKAIEDAALVYDRDSAKTRPNKALREYWPSTNTFRRIAWRATRMIGPASEKLLGRVQHWDMATMARIEIARALLGRQPTASRVELRY